MSVGVKALVHGRYSTYKNQRCRCGQCRAANASYQRGYMRRNPSQREKDRERHRVPADASTRRPTIRKRTNGCLDPADELALLIEEQRRELAFGDRDIQGRDWTSVSPARCVSLFQPLRYGVLMDLIEVSS